MVFAIISAVLSVYLLFCRADSSVRHSNNNTGCHTCHSSVLHEVRVQGFHKALLHHRTIELWPHTRKYSRRAHTYLSFSSVPRFPTNRKCRIFYAIKNRTATSGKETGPTYQKCWTSQNNCPMLGYSKRVGGPSTTILAHMTLHQNPLSV